MKNRLPILIFLLLATGYVAFVWSTRTELPNRVATHFNWQGVPDGWMTRDGLTRFTLALGLGVPLLIIAAFSVARFVPVRFVNLPNREYWLSPGRRAESVAWISRAGLWLACVLMAFMSVVHHFVVQANQLQPPRIDSRSLLIAVALLVTFQVTSIVRIFLRFSKPAA